MMRTLARAALVALTGLLAGCVVPLGPRDMPESRMNIGEQVPPLIVAGKTTRADVLLALGEPDGASQNELVFVYTHAARRGGFAVIMAAGSGIGGGSRQSMTYDRVIVGFDEAGVVTSARHERILCDENSFGAGQAGGGSGPCVDVAGRDLAPGSVAALQSSGQAAVFPHARWYPGQRAGRMDTLPPPWRDGTLVLAESALLLYPQGADSRSEPLLTLPYGEIKEVRAQNNFTLQRVVLVERTNGAFETFVVGARGDKPFGERKSTDRVVEIAQSHLR